MARGFLGGLILGSVVSVAGATGVALVVGPPPLPVPDAAQDVTPVAQVAPGRDSGTGPAPVVAQVAPMAAEAPPAPDAAGDSLSPMAGDVTQPAALPQTGAAEDTLTQPDAVPGDASVDVSAAAPVLPAPQAVLPPVPEAEENASIAADPAQPPAPVVGDENAVPPAPVAEPPAAPEVTAESAPAEDPPAEEAATEQPSAPADPAEEETAALRPAIGTPSTPLTERPDAAVSQRLPTVAAAPQDTPAAAEPPIRRYAAAFDNPEGKPLMSIVLIDSGAFSSAVEALAAFPYPVSFAIDATRADAAETMARYRAAGFEVLALANMPEGAQASDVEVALSAALATLPEAVAVMEGDGTGLQGARAVSDQVTAALAASGHGLLLFPKGLDTARKLAVKEGVPALSVFRDFDAKGQDANVIRRFLDQAAFKAGQEDQPVVMVGRTRPETVSALILWGLADRASRVALAPISAVLQAGAE